MTVAAFDVLSGCWYMIRHEVGYLEALAPVIMVADAGQQLRQLRHSQVVVVLYEYAVAHPSRMVGMSGRRRKDESPSAVCERVTVVVLMSFIVVVVFGSGG